MKVVGMVSSYHEGRLVRGAIDSILRVGLDRLYVYEGPAGEPLSDELLAELPPSELPTWITDLREVTVHHGRWRTDARKRNEMLQRAKTDFADERVWAIVVDADEVLVNAEYLRDRLEWLDAADQLKQANSTDEKNPPWARWPLRLVEHDGSISIITGRVFRADLLRSIDHSSSVVTNEAGVREGWGNIADVSALWIEGWLKAIDAGKMIAWPPMPCEPALVHRSNLRHPARASLRMSDQETREFAKARAEEEGGAVGELVLGPDGRLQGEMT